jgi:hypothetical protein
VVTLTDNEFNSDGYWRNPIAKLLYTPTYEDVELFDQNGYDLTQLEQHFAYGNYVKPKRQREHRFAIKKDWHTQFVKLEGCVLNHSSLFERKAYADLALEQLQHWADKLPLIHKVISIRAKWGLDFSMDYVDRQGNAFEVLHWEWDSFDFNEISAIKQEIEPILTSIDWTDAVNHLIKYKEKWHHLDFFAQSDWKCNYFGVPKERFKMVIWK